MGQTNKNPDHISDQESPVISEVRFVILFISLVFFLILLENPTQQNKWSSEKKDFWDAM